MTVWTIARHEIKIAFRSRWLFIFAGLFTVLSGIVVFFSGQTAGEFAGFTRTTASLLNLSLFLLPLLTLLSGSLLIAGEKEDGRMALLLTYPLASLSLIIGKFIGLAISLVAVLSLGYGISSLFLYQFASGNGELLFVFFGMSLLLVLMFLSLSVFVGVLSGGRLQALGIGIFLWAFFVLFYEFIMMGVTMAASPGWVLPILTVSVFLNPVELIRVFTVLFIGGGTVFGPSIYDFTIWANSAAGGLMFAAAAVLWVAGPLLASSRLMKRGKRL
ncbi:ABC transporter permease [Bacillus badius]|uniref:Nitrous oxide reductase maturation transmembrane protein NosY n=1 Tax=Bacillus badius TaxID=1455 RepID=A0ABR5AWL7_BACBA|nr:ABC transporter permease subunit [Bacillus badius]KIL79135.1 Nitrous oxide reductase maturation transmembrane protein NosY [Bacillus badius]MED4718765.1 ABC transporter permease subunit [Bacillus badius]